MNSPARIAVADHHPLFRDGVVCAIKRSSELSVVGTAKTTDETIAVLQECDPDVLVLDIGMPTDCLSMIKQFVPKFPSVNWLVLSAMDDEESVIEAISAGVSGYILKGASSTELLGAIFEVRQGRRYVAPELAINLLMKSRQVSLESASQSDAPPELTPRELQVLDGSAQGLSNREIANQLHVNVRMVKYWKTKLFEKMHVRNSLEAIAAAERWQLR